MGLFSFGKKGDGAKTNALDDLMDLEVEGYKEKAMEEGLTNIIPEIEKIEKKYENASKEERNNEIALLYKEAKKNKI